VSDEILNHSVSISGVETRVPFVNVEIKSSPSSGCTKFNKFAEKFEQTLFARELMTTVFIDRKCVLVVQP
jgi:hypothetical protein